MSDGLLVIICPACGETCQARMADLGKRGRCRCGEVFRIELPAGSPTLETITCLSIQQPWTDDVFFHGKWAENRSWATSYRGELWIHSSRIDTWALSEAKAAGHDLRKESPTGLMTGHIMGRVHLVECVTEDTLLAAASVAACEAMLVDPDTRPKVTSENRKEVEFLRRLLARVHPETWRHFMFAEYAWILAQPELLAEPIPTGGKLRLWKFEVASDRLVLVNRDRKSKPANYN